jgi:superfamily I DNA/RNA helicase
MPAFPPTAEQTAIVDASLTGENVVVRAGAGSGKTSTLVLVSEALSRKSIAYIAFNKDIATEAGHKMPANVEARTAHSFAYRGIVVFPKSKFGQRLDARNLTSLDIARALGITAPLTLDLTDGTSKTLKSSTLGYIARNTVERFCQSDHDEINRYNVPKQDGLDEQAQAKLAAYILPHAAKIWADVSDENGRTFKFDHCHYLKMFSLAGLPVKVKLNGGRATPAEAIMFDEAQDAAPVIRKIVQNQGVQTIVVGDENQAIYGFTGAVNALDAFDAKHDLKLTKSFRFGAAIAEVANKLLAQLDTDMRIVGHDPVPSEVLV